jgi:beta-glucosidase
MSCLPFFFSTGIENSYPVLSSGVRIDQMEKCGHYARWADDFALACELGVDALRYGPAYYRVHVAPDRFDWSSCDDAMEALRGTSIQVVADLCHFGAPSWLGGFQDPAFPVLFAHYARAFAKRYPWVRYYTPVNEIFICATFSALNGWWNECLRSERAFAWAVRNLAMAHELAVEAILAERPDAIIVQAESAENFQATCAASAAAAERLNGMKFLALDLTLGHELAPGLLRFMNEHGVPSNDLSFFRERRAVGQRWLGLDYYSTCEHRVASTGRQTTARRPRGFASLAMEYHTRYGLPIFHCETNAARNSVGWLEEQWRQISMLRGAGIPVAGFTWYSLTDQIDWQHALREERNDLHPVGLYDLKRRVRPVGRAYRELIARERAAAMVSGQLASV